MFDSNFAGEYSSPDISVIQINTIGVLCASGNMQQYGEGEWNIN